MLLRYQFLQGEFKWLLIDKTRYEIKATSVKMFKWLINKASTETCTMQKSYFLHFRVSEKEKKLAI